MLFAGTESIRPQLFVTRQNGTMVPLIAVDELPSTISIRGVPRILSSHDISGMTGVGTFNSRHRQYVVDDLNRGFEASPTQGDKSLIGSSFAMPVNRPGRSDLLWGMNRGHISTPPPKAYGIQEQPPSILKTPFANMAPSTPESSVKVAESDLPSFQILEELPIGRAPGIKEYCSYWLRHGECDYAQQGCLYRHEMPLDRLTLENLGLRDIPRWYREKHRLGSYLAGGNTVNGIDASSATKPNLMERNWRSHSAQVLVDGTRCKPDKEAQLHTPLTGRSTEQRKEKLNTSQDLPPKPAASMPKQFVSTSKPVEYTQRSTVLSRKPAYHAILSRHQPSTASTFRAKAAAAASFPNEETIATRQLRETIRMIDAYDQRERDRLSGKYQILEPQIKGIAVPANTPSTSTASSTSGGPEGEEMAEETVVVAKESSPSTKPFFELTSASPYPKPAGLRLAPVVKKRVGKPKRRGNHGMENGRVVEGRERMKAERLVDHD